jgi:GTP-binding protein HflX
MPTQLFERSRRGEHALLVQPHAGGPPGEGVLEEFGELARSAGASVAAVVTAKIDRPNPATLVGSGKLEELKAACEATGADLVLVNHALSPGQERNLERALERRVVDRTGLILDIFSQRARSAEGKLQVELAQLKHVATRLVRGWTHLERQRGGSIGLRGPGETQLETDRRLLQKRVDMLQKRLEKVEVQHTQMRRARVRSELPRVALVGYTNAGKSSLFNRLTGAGVFAENLLFATLDTTLRKLELPHGRQAMISDTVGFVSELPTTLVAAFRATLEEVTGADVILHVRDVANADSAAQAADVLKVLTELGVSAEKTPIIEVWNKIDLLDEGREVLQTLMPMGQVAATVPVSAHTGEGTEKLLETIEATLGKQSKTYRVRVPHTNGADVGWLYGHAEIIGKDEPDEEGQTYEVRVEPRHKASFTQRFAGRIEAA